MQSVRFWTLNIASFFAQMAISMVNLAIVYYLTGRFQASSSIIGFAASTYTITYLVGCLACAKLSEHISPRHLVESAVLGMALTVILMVLSPSLPFAFASFILYGLAMSMLWPQMETWITTGKEGKELNKVTSAFNFSWSFGTGLSSYAVAFLIERNPSWGLLGGCLLLLGVYLLVFAVSSLYPSIGGDVKAKHKVPSSSLVDQSTPLRFYAWASVILVYAALSVVLTIFPLYAIELGFSEKSAGVLLMIRGITTCLAFVYFGRVSWWQFRLSLIYLVQVLFALLCLVFAKASSFIAFAVFFFVFGLVFALCYDFSIFYSAAGAPNRNRRMVIHEVVLTIGSVIGALFGGIIYEKLGFSRILYAIAGLASIVLVMEWLFSNLCKRKEKN